MSANIKNDFYQKYTSNQRICKKTINCRSPYTPSFYQKINSAPVWSSDGHVFSQTKKIIMLLGNSSSEGLNPDDYHLNELKQISSKINNEKDQAQLSEEVALFDITLTDGVFLYLSDLAYGRINYKYINPQWSFVRRNIDIESVLKRYLHSGDIDALLHDVLPNLKLYSALKQKLALYQIIAINGGFPLISPGPLLKLGSEGQRVKELHKRLIMGGNLEKSGPKFGVFDNFTEDAVKFFQKNNGLKVTGTVDKKTLNVLNISVSARINTIAMNMDRLRMMPLDMDQELLLVNIPDYKLTIGIMRVVYSQCLRLLVQISIEAVF